MWYEGNDRVKQVNEINHAAWEAVEFGPTLADYNNEKEALVTDLVLHFTEMVDLPMWWSKEDTALFEQAVKDSL